MAIDIKKIMPALLLALLGLIFVFWNIYVILKSNAASLWDLKGPIVLIITGLLLFVFAVYYARNEDRQYKDEDDPEDEIEIIYEFDEVGESDESGEMIDSDKIEPESENAEEEK
ncbi:hypothetical protein MmiEs2_05280 [Methanimicrococcus stummii]|uniref:Uncharacterized protein n=1 Tax=Methanimicrococcus stummii TaxID=3028294 RepID=A0AA97A7T5_9EURY|nr:hypothetical protein [Methanimicrococcus sp. Es2]WNY28343.1 hypothetical protein MmiEs2_05280 [Methanimicrococcus sp. Es2]